MGGAHSSNKGIRGERELACILAGLYPNAHRGRQKTGQGHTGGSQAPDIDGTPFWIECKRAKTVMWRKSYYTAVRESLEANDPRPVILIARPDREEWMAHLSLKTLMELLGWDFSPVGEKVCVLCKKSRKENSFLEANMASSGKEVIFCGTCLTDLEAIIEYLKVGRG